MGPGNGHQGSKSGFSNFGGFCEFKAGAGIRRAIRNVTSATMKPVLTALVGVIALVVALAQGNSAYASFHCMRIHAVMGGANGNTGIQYVELRMNAGGQTLVNGHVLRFYNAGGSMTGSFTIPAPVSNGATGASILIGTSGLQAAAGVTPDFVMPSNVIAPSGKVTFAEGFDNCQFGGPSVVDSVAYGSTYTGGVDYGSKFPSNLPTGGAQALTLNNLNLEPVNNATEYALQAAAPRNNAGAVGSFANTPTGTNVQVSPDPAVTVTFAQVTAAGDTTATTSGTGPVPPTGFSLGTPTVYYEIATTATFTGTVTVCIDYDDQFVSEAGLNLFHHDGADWTDVTTSLDTVGNEICGEVAGFSPFLVALPDVDGDSVSDLTDNCSGAANGPAEAGVPGVGNQTNSDAANETAGFRLGTGSPPPVLAGDPQGDACDADDDNDFFSDADERHIFGVAAGSAPERTPCRTVTIVDPWPVDISPTGAPDKVVDTSDVLLVLGFVGLGPASQGYDVRYDLADDAGDVIDTAEVLLLLGFVGLACTSP